jgi:hypothetical protein
MCPPVGFAVRERQRRWTVPGGEQAGRTFRGAKRDNRCGDLHQPPLPCLPRQHYSGISCQADGAGLTGRNRSWGRCVERDLNAIVGTHSAGQSIV